MNFLKMFTFHAFMCNIYVTFSSVASYFIKNLNQLCMWDECKKLFSLSLAGKPSRESFVDVVYVVQTMSNHSPETIYSSWSSSSSRSTKCCLEFSFSSLIFYLLGGPYIIFSRIYISTVNVKCIIWLKTPKFRHDKLMRVRSRHSYEPIHT